MIVKMKKVALLGVLPEQTAVLDKVQRFGRVQFVGEQKADKLAPLVAVQSRRDEIEFCIAFLDRYRVKTRNLLASFNIVSRELCSSDADRLAADTQRLDEAISTVRGYEKRLGELESRQNSINTEKAALAPWDIFTTPLEQLCDTKTTAVMTGYVMERDANPFLREMESREGMAAVAGGIVGDNNYFIAAVHKSLQNEWDNIAKEYNFTRVDLSGVTGTAEQAETALNAEYEALENEKSEIMQTASGGELLDYFENMSDLLALRGQLLGAGARSEDTAACYIMEGWIPEEDCERLVGELEKSDFHVAVDFEDVEESDEPPALVRNKKVPSYFEGIVDAFSHPNYRDVDPNTLVSIFYSIFFGMMLADAGYGILLVLVTGAALLFGKMKKGMRRLMGVFFYGGLSAIFMGIMFGSYFGAEIFKPVLVSPLEQPLIMIGISLALGVAHLFAGYLAKAYKNVRDGDWFAAIFDQGFWILFITGLCLLLAPVLIAGETGVLIGNIGKWTAIVSAVVLLCTQGRSSKTLFGKIGGGLGSLYNVTGFLSDALSYTRLFALCLSSGVIGSVFNQMAMLFSTDTVVGVICMVLVMLIGHSLNIALSLLSAYVHTNRLQYVEFLGKFFDGGGEDFEPLCRNTEYITVVPDASVRNNIN